MHDAMRGVVEPLRKSETMRNLLRGAVYGRQANYFLRGKTGHGA